jgi:hypothetical protein
MADDRRDEIDGKELGRRAFLRRAAATGLAAAWVAPVVQSIAATPAYAQTIAGTPVPQDCFHSFGGGCMAACEASGCPGEACDGVDPDPCNPYYAGDGPCQYFCPSGQGGNNPCCNPGLCDPRNFECRLVPNCDADPKKVAKDPLIQIAVYKGSLVGCPQLTG